MRSFIKKFTTKIEDGRVSEDGQYLNGQRVADVNFYEGPDGEPVLVRDLRKDNDLYFGRELELPNNADYDMSVVTEGLIYIDTEYGDPE